MNGWFFRFKGAGLKNDNAEPIIKAIAVTVEIQYDLCKKPIIEKLIGLKLNFGKIDNLWRCICWRQKDPINTESGFLDLNRLKAIVLGL
jgi:hypothetical protein